MRAALAACSSSDRAASGLWSRPPGADARWGANGDWDGCALSWVPHPAAAAAYKLPCLQISRCAPIIQHTPLQKNTSPRLLLHSLPSVLPPSFPMWTPCLAPCCFPEICTFSCLIFCSPGKHRGSYLVPHGHVPPPRSMRVAPGIVGPCSSRGQSGGIMIHCACMPGAPAPPTLACMHACTCSVLSALRQCLKVQSQMPRVLSSIKIWIYSVTGRNVCYWKRGTIMLAWLLLLLLLWL